MSSINVNAFKVVYFFHPAKKPPGPHLLCSAIFAKKQPVPKYLSIPAQSLLGRLRRLEEKTVERLDGAGNIAAAQLLPICNATVIADSQKIGNFQTHL